MGGEMISVIRPASRPAGVVRDIKLSRLHLQRRSPVCFKVPYSTESVQRAAEVFLSCTERTISLPKSQIPRLLKRDHIKPVEISRTYFKHRSGKEYEVGLWASSEGVALDSSPMAEELKKKFMPHLSKALERQRQPISVDAIQAAMIVEGRLPLCKSVYEAAQETLQFHAFVTKQPADEVEEVKRAFEKQVQEHVNQVEAKIEREEKEERACLAEHGISRKSYQQILVNLTFYNPPAVASGVIQHPEKDAEEVQKAFDEQIKQAVERVKAQYQVQDELKWVKLKSLLDRYIHYHHRDLQVGSPPDFGYPAKMLIKDRIKETQKLLEQEDEGCSLAKRSLKWLRDWEKRHPFSDFLDKV